MVTNQNSHSLRSITGVKSLFHAFMDTYSVVNDVRLEKVLLNSDVRLMFEMSLQHQYKTRI